MTSSRRRDPSIRSGRRRLQYFVPAPPVDADPIDLDVMFTKEALRDLLVTVGGRPPESGAKLFGPVDGFGIDVVEFDVRGSEHAGGAIYAPDTEWGSERLEFWIQQPGEERRIWTGDAHSHPGGFGWPSQRTGPGLGDLGYVKAVFEQNEIQAEFCIPILTGTGSGQPVHVHPWVVLRTDPLRPRWARFKVRPAAEFPERRFNQAWVDRVEGRTPSPPLLDLDVLADALVALCGRRMPILELDDPSSVEIDAGESIIRIDLGDDGTTLTATILKGLGTGMQAGTTDPDTSFDRELTAASLVVVALDAGRTVRARSARQLAALPPASPVAPEPSADPIEAEPIHLLEDAEPVGFGPDEYYARADGLLTPGFHERSILVVGASGGSYLIEKLARLGPRRLVIVDPDVVEVPNLVRTAFGTEQVGMAKPEAMAELIASANPFVAVEAVARDITQLSRDEVDQLLDGIDLIIAGTDSFEAQALMNVWSQTAGIPGVFIGVHQGAAGGIIRWSVPGETACYRCAATGRYEASDAAEPDDDLDLPGEAGLLIDVQAIDMVAASIVIGLLERGADTPKGRLIERLGDCSQVVVSTSPAYPWGQELFSSLIADLPPAPNREEDLATYLGVLPIITLPTAPVPDCPDCAMFTTDPTDPNAPTAPTDQEDD